MEKEIIFKPLKALKETDTAGIRILKPENIKGFCFAKAAFKDAEDTDCCDGKIYVDLGNLSDYSLIKSKDGSIDFAEKILENTDFNDSKYLHKRVQINTDCKKDRLFAIVYRHCGHTIGQITEVKYGVLRDGKIYNCKKDFAGSLLTYTLHSNQENLHTELCAIFEDFTSFVYNWLVKNKLRPIVEEEIRTKDDTFISDGIQGTTYCQIRKQNKDKPLNGDNIKIYTVEQWRTIIKI